MKAGWRWRWVWGVLALLAVVLGAQVAAGLAAPTALAQTEGQVPGDALGSASDADLWRAIRRGERGYVPIPDPSAGQLIQSQGESWREIRNGPLATYGAWALLAIVVLLILFFALRGRIRIQSGRSGRTITRFGFLDRFAHWLTATCFVVLALTGLNLLYGRDVLLPVLGPGAFGTITMAGKYLHNYLAFGFMIGLVLMAVLWIRHNLPSRHDFVWLAKGGGMFTKHGHAPAKKFNAGQKLLFWIVILGGASVSFSGLMLMFPFEFTAFGPTFELVNGVLGTDYPSQLTPVGEQQFAQVWHAIMGLFLTVVIIGHIYIGTIGMEGAFSAMGSGEVDENWAREHHDLWVEELRRKRAARGEGDLDETGALAAGDD